MRVARSPLRARSIMLGAMLCVSLPARAQQAPAAGPVDAADLDPSSEMAPLPGMEVEWPDSPGDEAAPAASPSTAAAPGVKPVDSLSADTQSDRHYSVAI